MAYPVVSFTAVYLKTKYDYVGFIEEPPGVNAHGQTIAEARGNLQRVAAEIFALERAQSTELLNGRDVVREGLAIPVVPVA